MNQLSPAAAQRAFLVLTATRWFPVGVVVGVTTLWKLERGLTVELALTAAAVSGLVVFLLELPTSSFADVFGRRPVYLAAGVMAVLTAAAYLVADSFWLFALASALMGISRALDSGPLEAWYVDTVHASAPDADVAGPLARQSTLLGTSIALGALISGGLVWWHPVKDFSALWLPMLVCLVLSVVHLLATAALMHEPRAAATERQVARAIESARQSPRVVGESLRLARTNRILSGLLLVEIFWSITMVVFETFMPIRLAELLGSEERAGIWMGPLAAVGWAVFGLGAALAGWSSLRLGVVRTAMLARLLNCLGAVAMGLVGGPVALAVAYLFTYSMHGSSGPMHSALLHREATSANRATVLSLNSMMAFGAFAVATPLLGVFATRTSTPVAMVSAGLLGLVGVLCYLPARRAEAGLR